MKAVLLDADGTHALGHYVLVFADSGIVFSHQCGGPRNLTKSAEGYLVDVGPEEAVDAVGKFLVKKFGSGEYNLGKDYEVRETLKNLISDVTIWLLDDENGAEPHPLSLDKERLGELTEAWIPVRTPLGEGVLIYKNRD